VQLQIVAPAARLFTFLLYGKVKKNVKNGNLVGRLKAGLS